MERLKIYLTQYEKNGNFYGDEIKASSWEDAETKVRKRKIDNPERWSEEIVGMKIELGLWEKIKTFLRL